MTEPVASSNYPICSPRLGDRLLARDLWRQMLRIRLVEERIAAEYPRQEIRCPVHLCIGQEAVAVGIASALSARDYTFSAHRSHGHFLAAGGNLKSLIAELYGRRDGCCVGRGGSMHLIDLECGFLGATPIVGSTIPIAVGAAFAAVMRQDDRVSVVYFGDGATEEGIFHEALNFASLHALPVLFVCENNAYSAYSPLSVRQPSGRPLSALGNAHAILTIEGDGNNVLEVARIARRAVCRARQGEGPSFLVFSTYRWREHCGPNYDNDIGYRTEEEFLCWRDRDPIWRLESELLSEGVLDTPQIDAVRDGLEAEIDAAFRAAHQGPFPDPDDLLAHVYAS